MQNYSEIIPFGNSDKELTITDCDDFIFYGIIQIAEIVTKIRSIATNVILGEINKIHVDIEKTRLRIRFITEYSRVLREEIIPLIARFKAYEDAHNSVKKLGLSPERERLLIKELLNKEKYKGNLE